MCLMSRDVFVLLEVEEWLRETLVEVGLKLQMRELVSALEDHDFSVSMPPGAGKLSSSLWRR